MSNVYFNHVSNVIASGIRALAAQVNNIAYEVALGFDKLPTETELKTNTTIYAGDDTGAADAYVVSLTYTPTYSDGLNFFWKAKNANTGASTINVNGLGAKTILLASGAALVSGDILLNQQLWLAYESVSDTFRIMSQSSSAGGGGGNATTLSLLDESTDTETFVTFSLAATGNQAIRTGTNLTFNSNTGALAATSFTGDVTGNADTATTADTVTTAEQPSITSVGTLSSLAVTGPITSGAVNSDVKLNTTVLIIGDWNMDSTSTRIVLHGVTLSKIRTVSLLIRNDNDDSYRPGHDVSPGAWVNDINGSAVNLTRTTSGDFDNTDYDSTGFNRGWITIQYID